ncbi:MAG: PadR family transcriptional regulator [Actinomycetales bacterium]
MFNQDFLPGSRRGRPMGPRGHRHHHDPGNGEDFAGPDPDDGPHGGHGGGHGGGPHRGRRGGFGPGFGPGGGPFGQGFGAGGPFGRGGFGPGRVRKGNVRSAILSLLSQSGYNGYGLIKAIAVHTDGAWRPSPGSVYPTLAALQADGLIESTGEGRRTEFVLTDAGRAYVAAHAKEMAEVWEDVSEEAGTGQDLRRSAGKLLGAVRQISMDGTDDQLRAATAALDEARRTLYRLLSD